MLPKNLDVAMNPDLSQVQRHVAQVFHADEVALLGASRLQEVLVGDDNAGAVCNSAGPVVNDAPMDNIVAGRVDLTELVKHRA